MTRFHIATAIAAAILGLHPAAGYSHEPVSRSATRPLPPKSRTDAHVTVSGTTIICDAPFEVYDLAGRHAASASGSVTLAPGIYLVKTGATTAKVLLR